jgi:hypothetical protein
MAGSGPAMTWKRRRVRIDAGGYGKKAVTFLKKVTKKLLQIGRQARNGHGTNEQKFFASFFQKRSSCLLFCELVKEDSRFRGNDDGSVIGHDDWYEVPWRAVLSISVKFLV